MHGFLDIPDSKWMRLGIETNSLFMVQQSSTLILTAARLGLVPQSSSIKKKILTDTQPG
jgi:hypothetical protein